MPPLSPTAKSFRVGTHRIVPPEVTLERARACAAAMGITRLADVTGLDHIGIPVAMAVRPNSRSLSVSQGKGVTLAQAMASAMMETIEQFHAEDLLPRCEQASAAELAADGTVLEVGLLPRGSRRRRPTTKLPWMRGHDILNDVPCWVPYELVHADDTLPVPKHAGYFAATTNGLASGNHPAEAISAGICEVVERDAEAIFRAAESWFRRYRELDPASVDDPLCRGLLDKLARARIEVAIWDITSDIGIAAFRCHIRERPHARRRRLGTFRGAGCHPAREVALARAITEAAQSRLTHIAGSRDDLSAGAYQRSVSDRLWEAWLQGRSRSVSRVRFGDVSAHSSADVGGDVAWELERLRAAGLRQATVVDLTRAEFGISVVRVVVAGLEGVYEHPGYSPGLRARRAQARRA